MSVTVVAALLVSPSVGLLAPSDGYGAKYYAAVIARAEARARGEMLDQGWRSLQGETTAPAAERLPGLLSHYATAALEEDKAEVFAFLMTAPAAVRRIAARDRIVRAKVAATKAQLARLAPEIDARFWASVEAGRR